MTGAKENAVQVRKAVTVEELKLPAPNDYQHHKKNIIGCLDSLESAKSRYRKALQSAQQAGIDTNALLEARRIVRANDPKKTAASLNQLAFALEQEGFSIHITVTDTLTADHADGVYERFFADGEAGRTLVNPYPVGSDLAAIAAKGWRNGQAKNLGVSAEDADKAAAAAEAEKQEGSEAGEDQLAARTLETA